MRSLPGAGPEVLITEPAVSLNLGRMLWHNKVPGDECGRKLKPFGEGKKTLRIAGLALASAPVAAGRHVSCGSEGTLHREPCTGSPASDNPSAKHENPPCVGSLRRYPLRSLQDPEGPQKRGPLFRVGANLGHRIRPVRVASMPRAGQACGRKRGGEVAGERRNGKERGEGGWGGGDHAGRHSTTWQDKSWIWWRPPGNVPHMRGCGGVCTTALVAWDWVERRRVSWRVMMRSRGRRNQRTGSIG